MKIYTSKFKNELLRIHIGGLDSWDSLEKVANFFLENFEAIIVDKADGVDARSWSMTIKGKPIILVYDDLLGNYFYSENPDDEYLLKELAEALKNSKEL